ncbi:hypothetical protein X975_20711, partial [Stegodyphus mimosarum]
MFPQSSWLLWAVLAHSALVFYYFYLYCPSIRRVPARHLVVHFSMIISFEDESKIKLTIGNFFL